jgi:hypothetical protein
MTRIYIDVRDILVGIGWLSFVYLGDTSNGTSDELVHEGEGLGLVRHDGRLYGGKKQRVVCTSLQVKHNGWESERRDG